MAEQMIRVYRTPLVTGEVPYAIRRIYLGINPKTGKDFPFSQALPRVLEDGGLVWEVLDNARNRAHVKAACADSFYTIVLPEDQAGFDEKKLRPRTRRAVEEQIKTALGA